MVNKFICKILGHNYRCLARYLRWQNNIPYSETTGWKCQRCSRIEHQQWDYPLPHRY